MGPHRRSDPVTLGISGERPVTGDPLGGLAKIAKRLAEERPDDLLVQQLALVFKMASREDIERMQ
jgi:hypothetical protein